MVSPSYQHDGELMAAGGLLLHDLSQEPGIFPARGAATDVGE